MAAANGQAAPPKRQSQVLPDRIERLQLREDMHQKLSRAALV